jgi:hypothetical protein
MMVFTEADYRTGLREVRIQRGARGEAESAIGQRYTTFREKGPRLLFFAVGRGILDR